MDFLYEVVVTLSNYSTIKDLRVKINEKVIENETAKMIVCHNFKINKNKLNNYQYTKNTIAFSVQTYTKKDKLDESKTKCLALLQEKFKAYCDEIEQLKIIISENPEEIFRSNADLYE